MPNTIYDNIIETEDIEEILKHVTCQTAIFCDLDNTLVEPCQHFGTVQWGEYYGSQLIANGTVPEEVEGILQKVWNQFFPKLAMRLLDPKVPAFLSQLKQDGHLVLGLTARYPEDAVYTHSQLKEMGIEFDGRFSDQHISLPYPASFANGIIFTSALNKKSAALVSWMKQINYYPKKIIFIDDKQIHVEDLVGPVSELNIEYLGIRYSKADKRVNAFDPQIAELQMKLFPEYVSDDEARLRLMIP